MQKILYKTVQRTSLTKNIAAVMLPCMVLACGSPAQVTVSKSTPPKVESLQRVEIRPHYNPDGTQLVFANGQKGSRQIQVMSTVTSEVREFKGPGDNVDPSWTPDGRIVYASNRNGDFDLYILDPTTGDSELIIHLDGDERAPSVSGIPFGFFAVHNGICGGPASGKIFDAYYKLLFARDTENKKEIWFTSIRPLAPPSANNVSFKVPSDLVMSPHGAHLGRVSDEGKACTSPRFAPDSLSAVWHCTDGIEDAWANYAHSFPEALKAVTTRPKAECSDWNDAFDYTRCLSTLERRYATYPGGVVSTPELQLTAPTVSANQILIVADSPSGMVSKSRFDKDAPWQPMPASMSGGSQLDWSPTGTEVAMVRDGAITRINTDFYLQTVRNLRHFPELVDSGESELLDRNRFVARGADHKEFHVLHDQLRYADKPQFISADVALQAFRDEFLRIIRDAERQAAASVHQLTRALMRHYVHKLNGAKGEVAERDRYMAILFATAWAPLEAAARMEVASDDDIMSLHWDDIDDAFRNRVKQLARPTAERIPEELPAIVDALPGSIREAVAQRLDQMLAHEGFLEVTVPLQSKPLKVDFSQFRIRGAYAENDLGAYFLAMAWLAAMPIPIDEGLKELNTVLHSTRISGKSAYELWEQVDATVGSFMGRPVDATPGHVAAELATMKSWDQAKLTQRLLERRGDVPIRDANKEKRELMVTVFPKRVGLDVTFFSKLTWPAVRRAFPSSLDVFASLGNAQAKTHMLALPEEDAATYRKVLERLISETAQKKELETYASTDLYHSWLAALVALATPIALPEDSKLEFAKQLAWRDKQLYSALAGYTQLKHSAVLYAMQDMSAECDGETSYYVAVEEPFTPRPMGFVEPAVDFYDHLTALADQCYSRLMGDPQGPNYRLYLMEGEPNLNAKNFVQDLATIARQELRGEPLTREQALFIEYIGGKLEPIALGFEPGYSRITTGGEGRIERGVALITDIHTNVDRQQVLAIGVGRIFDLWVVVPTDTGEQLTQGGMLSFYEFIAPMADRPTDAAWGKVLSAGNAPALPDWTSSFIDRK